MIDVERRITILEEQVAELRALLIPPVLSIIARVIGDRAFTVRDLYVHAAVANDVELSAALAATTPRKLGALLAHCATVTVVENSSQGLTYIIRRIAPESR